MAYLTALSKVLPILLLLLLGVWLNRRQFIRPETVQDFKKLVINLTLPALLFLAFSQVSLEARHLLVVGLVFASCLLALFLARLVRPLSGIPSPYFPMLMTGFEAGMMGYAIFGAVFGAENIVKFGIIDLGQVIFVFFVLVTALERTASGARPFGATLLSFVKTPVILAILAGILINRFGLTGALRGAPLSASLLAALELLGSLTTPLVAMVIGYEMRLQWRDLRRPLASIGLRLAFWVPVGLLLNFLVIDRLLHLDPLFQAAVMTMFILPPPFVIPLFMTGAAPDERYYVVNTLSLATLVTLFAFAVVSIFYAV